MREQFRKLGEKIKWWGQISNLFFLPTGCLILIDMKYDLIARTKKHHWS
jgi:hypothetical protein